MSSFIVYGGRSSSGPRERITSIGGEPVEYATYKFMGREIPTTCVKSVGGKPVEYGKSFGGFSDRITSIGGEPVTYSFWRGMTHIGDKPVESSRGTGRIIRIGGKKVKYSKYPFDFHTTVCQGVITAVLGIGIFSLYLYSRLKSNL